MSYMINPFRFGNVWAGEAGGNCQNPNVVFEDLVVMPAKVGLGGNWVGPWLSCKSVTHSLASDDDLTIHVNCQSRLSGIENQEANPPLVYGGYSCQGGSNFLNDNLLDGMNFTVADLTWGQGIHDHGAYGINLYAADSVNAEATEWPFVVGEDKYWIIRVIAFDSSGCESPAWQWIGPRCSTVPIHVNVSAYWARQPNTGNNRGVIGSCTTPEASYTDLALTQSTTSGCFRKPILTATSVSHSLSSDADLGFWINCKLGTDSTSTFGEATCASGSDLVAGKLFPYADLQSGIDLLAFDSINAAAQDADDGTAVGWDVRCTAVDLSDCPTIACADSGGYIQNLSLTESATYDGPELYVDGLSGTFPQFRTHNSVTTSFATGSSYDYVLRVGGNLEYFADSSSLGDDSFGATDFKIEIQYDTSCDTSGGCGSYSWTNGIDNDTFLAAGTGGGGYEQTFDVAEADCWNEEYLFVRYRIVAAGACGNADGIGDWTTSTLGEVDVVGGGADCELGGGP